MMNCGIEYWIGWQFRCLIAEVSAKMSQDASTSRSAGKSKVKSVALKCSHPSYATMIKQSLAAMQVC